ncbi:phosphoglycerate mutase-like protein [Rostrohypoxylon terebratum]|nr:phosphoglycerate mutase-like protein [Rostrohypoxylon terebratum]
MPPTVILVRHGEALHTHNWSLHDPGLTARGMDLSARLQCEFEGHFRFTPEDCLIVVSPLKRTLQTVKYGFQWLRDLGVRVEVRAEWQETTDNPCDIGSDPDKLKSEWPDLDFSTLDPIYPQKIGLYENSEDAFKKRGEVAKQWLYDRPEKCVIVVTHSGFIRRLVKGPKYGNLEHRTYSLVKTQDSLEFEEISKVIYHNL